MTEFEESPRSAKKRKIDGKSTATSKDASEGPTGVLSSLTNAVSGISKRLFAQSLEQGKEELTGEGSVSSPEEVDRSHTEAPINEADASPSEQESHVSSQHKSVGRLSNAASSIFPVVETQAPANRERTGSTESTTGTGGRKRSSDGEFGTPHPPLQLSSRRTSAKRRIAEQYDLLRQKEENSPPDEASIIPAFKRTIIERPPPRPPKDKKPPGKRARTSKTKTSKEGQDGTEVVDQEDGAEAQAEGTEQKRRPRAKRKSVGQRRSAKRVTRQLDFQDEPDDFFGELEEQEEEDDLFGSDDQRLEVEPNERSSSEEHASSIEEPAVDEPEASPLVMMEIDPSNPVDPCLMVADGNISLIKIKYNVLSRLTSRSLTPLTNLASEYSKVHSLLSATITAGEGNSMLVLGPRGCGKTALIETALSELGESHGQDFHVVRLSGFNQTDDKLALRDIWRQLGREMQVEDDETDAVSSYADTMASLLQVLSHPEELSLLPNAINPSVHSQSKSVIFIIDEFDLFTTHSRQTLLYNLFDIAQSRKAPIAVVGVSTLVSAADSLEKRVKSRFSHRWVHVAPPKNIAGFEAILKSALTFSDTEIDTSAAGNDEDNDHDESENLYKAWNAYITNTFLPSTPARTLLHKTFTTTKSIPALFSALYFPISAIPSFTTPVSALPFPDTSPPDSILETVSSLPTLHLHLLIAAARLEAIHSATSVTFSLAYTHYSSLIAQTRLQGSAAGQVAQGAIAKTWKREVAKGAWEELVQRECLVAASAAASAREQALENRLYKCDVAIEEIQRVLGGMDGVGEMALRWCREI